MLRATRVHPEFGLSFEYGAVTLYGRAFQLCSPKLLQSSFPNSPNERINSLLNCVPSFGELGGCPTTPTGKPIGLASSAFARRYLRNLFEFSSSGYLDVSVHLVPSSHPMYSGTGDWALPQPGFPIRTSTAHRFCAAPRRFSQLTRPSSANCP